MHPPCVACILGLPWERALHADASCGSEALSVDVEVGVDGVEVEVGDVGGVEVGVDDVDDGVDDVDVDDVDVEFRGVVPSLDP